MTTIKHVYSGVDFSSRASSRIAALTQNRTALTGEYLLGRNLNTSKYNLTDSAKPLYALGSPVYLDRAATCNSGIGFETYLTDGQDMTLLVVAALSVANSSASLIGGYLGVGTDCCLLSIGNGTLAGYTSATDNTGQSKASATGPTISDTAYRVFALRTNAGSDYVLKLDQFKAGVRLGGAVQTNTGKTKKISTPTIRIGTSGGFPGAVSIAGAYVRNGSGGYLSDADLLADVVQITALMATYGISC